MIGQLIFIALANSASMRQSVHYKVQALGTIGGDPLLGRGINDSGQVAATLLGMPKRAYIWSHGKATALETPKRTETQCFGINNSGECVGVWHTSVPDAGGAAIWTAAGKFIKIPSKGFMIPAAINNRRTVVGRDTDTVQAFKWSPGSGEVALGGGGAATAVNQSDEIVGYRPGAGRAALQFVGFAMKGKATRTFTTANLSNTQALGINNSGDILLIARDDSGSTGYSFVLEHSKRKRILPLPKGYTISMPTAINERGDVIGTTMSADRKQFVPVVWPGKRGVIILTDVAKFPKNVIEVLPRAINNSGQILVTGLDAKREVSSSFVLTPTH